MARTTYPRGQEPWRDFTVWLQREVQNSGKTQRQLADEIGVTQSQVSRWLDGDYRPRPDIIEQIGLVFGIDRQILLHLAGYAANILHEPSEDLSLDAQLELESATAFFEHLLRTKVPRPFWAALRQATGSLAEALADLPSSQPPQEIAPPSPTPPEKPRKGRRNVDHHITAFSRLSRRQAHALIKRLNLRVTNPQPQRHLDQLVIAH